MKPLELRPGVWNKIYKQIAKEYPPSVLLIRDRMRKVLGFTSRTHRHWVENPKAEYEWDRGHYKECIMLDFFDERKRTMFLLKYSDLINETSL